jgi:hypothetical protein
MEAKGKVGPCLFSRYLKDASIKIWIWEIKCPTPIITRIWCAFLLLQYYFNNFSMLQC